MFYSENLKLLFIACPKTGSTTVESVLLSIDPNGERFTLSRNGKTLTRKDCRSGSLGHATAGEFKHLLGAQDFSSLKSFGFVRHPVEKIVSSYFFMKQYRFSEIFSARAETPTQTTRTILKTLTSSLLARVLPFEIYARVFPMKTAYNYFTDDSGKLLINLLGSTERLETDLKQILKEFGIQTYALEIRVENRSDHGDPWKYVQSKSLRRYLERKYENDITLYNLTQNGVFKNN